jgi:hypothetical protein
MKDLDGKGSRRVKIIASGSDFSKGISVICYVRTTFFASKFHIEILRCGNRDGFFYSCIHQYCQQEVLVVQQSRVTAQ